MVPAASHLLLTVPVPSVPPVPPAPPLHALSPVQPHQGTRRLGCVPHVTPRSTPPDPHGVPHTLAPQLPIHLTTPPPLRRTTSNPLPFFPCSSLAAIMPALHWISLCPHLLALVSSGPVKVRYQDGILAPCLYSRRRDRPSDSSRMTGSFLSCPILPPAGLECLLLFCSVPTSQ